MPKRDVTRTMTIRVNAGDANDQLSIRDALLRVVKEIDDLAHEWEPESMTAGEQHGGSIIIYIQLRQRRETALFKWPQAPKQRLSEDGTVILTELSDSDTLDGPGPDRGNWGNTPTAVNTQDEGPDGD